MTSHDPYKTLLSGVDAPVAPNPLFARRLRNQFLAELSDQSSVPANVLDLGAVRRNRLLDLAAVAILVVSMIGGMLGINSGTFVRATPTARAADIASPTATTTPGVSATISPEIEAYR